MPSGHTSASVHGEEVHGLVSPFSHIAQVLNSHGPGLNLRALVCSCAIMGVLLGLAELSLSVE